jgi:hypothetical protein
MAKLNFYKTLASLRQIRVGPCPLPLEYQAAKVRPGPTPLGGTILYTQWGLIVQGKDVVAWQLYSAVGQDTSEGIIGTSPKHGQASYMKAEMGRRCEKPGVLLVLSNC